MTTNELKQRVYAAIDRRAEEIVGLGERIRKQPELGFKEVKTARLVEDTLAGLGLKPKAGLALTGVRAEAPGRASDGPTFALLGELDALVVAGHPDGDPTTGSAHACGHHAQVAAPLRTWASMPSTPRRWDSPPSTRSVRPSVTRTRSACIRSSPTAARR